MNIVIRLALTGTDAFPLDTSRAFLQRTTRLVRPYKSLLVTRVTRQISGYDTTIGVALTRRATPITLFICDERVLIAGAS